MNLATGDQAVKLEEKRNMFLSLVRKYPGISRRECATAMRVSTFYASKLVPELIAAGMITESETSVNSSGNSSGRGRPTKPLYLNPEYEYFAGVDLEASSWRMVISNFQGDLIHTFVRPFEICKTRQEYLLQIDSLMNEAMTDAGEKWQKVRTMGIGAPGFLNSETGVVNNYELLSGFKNIPMRDICKLTACKPVFIQNNIYNFATYDLLKHPEAAEQSIIHVAIRSGISAALSLNGTVYRGSNNMAGEAGLSLFPNHKMLQEVAGIRSLGKQLTALPAKFWHGTPEAVNDAMQNHQYAAILQEAIKLTAISLANITSFIDPNKLIIYSKIFSNPNQLWELLEKEFNACRIQQGLDSLILYRGGEAEFIPALGAAIFAIEQTYRIA